MARTVGAGVILAALLVIVIGLALVSTVATSTTSASTALAPFAGAQSLVIIVPLIFVAIIIFAAYRHVSRALELQLAKVSRWLFMLLSRRTQVVR